MVLAPTSARALAIYLRARRDHPLADSDWVWLGTHGRGRFQNTGIRKMLIRQSEALAKLVDRIEYLRNEQRRRQQQLDQPVEGHNPGSLTNAGPAEQP